MRRRVSEWVYGAEELIKEEEVITEKEFFMQLRL